MPSVWNLLPNHRTSKSSSFSLMVLSQTFSEYLLCENTYQQFKYIFPYFFLYKFLFCLLQNTEYLSSTAIWLTWAIYKPYLRNKWWITFHLVNYNLFKEVDLLNFGISSPLPLCSVSLLCCLIISKLCFYSSLGIIWPLSVRLF
jgi:hypothetical protein